MIDIEARFWDKVLKTQEEPEHVPGIGGCWLWTGHRQHKGYGMFRVGKFVRLAHRYSFFLEYGRWPKTLALHKCDNRACVRPCHLFEGDDKDNANDRKAKGRGGSAKISGEGSPWAKVTQLDVHTIRAASCAAKELAEMFGVNPTTIYGILNGKSWRRFPGAIV